MTGTLGLSTSSMRINTNDYDALHSNWTSLRLSVILSTLRITLRVNNIYIQLSHLCKY